MWWWLILPISTGTSAAALTALFATRHPSRSIVLAWIMAVLATVLVLRQMPSLARRAGAAGRLVRATALYQWVARLAIRRSAVMQAQLSLAAVAIERGAIAQANQLLATSRDVASAIPAARAVWHNNRAYLALRQGEATSDLIEDARHSWQSFPHVEGFAHTYALACIYGGQLDTAIAVLEGMSPAIDDASLRAQRAWDLGRAWMAMGQPSYAARYQAEAKVLWSQGDAVPWYAAGTAATTMPA